MRRSWCWRRWISPGREDFWLDRLRTLDRASWALTERPPRSRVLLEVYTASRAEALSLNHEFGGQVRELHPEAWLKRRAAAPLRIARKLEIVHDPASLKKAKTMPRLCVPHGVAFGSGEHATTGMLLRALCDRTDWDRLRVLDLGTGSGILALASRLFGARRIVGADFDADAVRTATQNEALIFSTPLIRWRREDVKRLRSMVTYDLVLANLFSGILVQAAPQIAASVAAPDGELWLSGILLAQKEEVIAAYGARRMRLLQVVRRGKWIMLKLAHRPGKRGANRLRGFRKQQAEPEKPPKRNSRSRPRRK
jgi:ribosomal protein L11 methyltransferase